MSATRYLEPMGRDVRHNSCFKGLFMHRLLTKGYHFQQWEDISIVKRVADSEVGWTLGYMIQRSNSAVSTTGICTSQMGRDFGTQQFVSTGLSSPFNAEMQSIGQCSKHRYEIEENFDRKKEEEDLCFSRIPIMECGPACHYFGLKFEHVGFTW